MYTINLRFFQLVIILGSARSQPIVKKEKPKKVIRKEEIPTTEGGFSDQESLIRFIVKKYAKQIEEHKKEIPEKPEPIKVISVERGQEYASS